MRGKIYGVITASKNPYYSYNVQKNLYDYLSRKIGKFYILDLNNFLIFKNKAEEYKLNKFPKNIKYFKPKNYLELKKFLTNVDFVAFNSVGRSFNYYYILFLIKFYNIKLVLLLNVIALGNRSDYPIFNFKNFLKKIFLKFDFIIFRILVFLNIFPNIDLLLTSEQKTINLIKRKYFFHRLKKITTSINFTYFKKIALVGNRETNFSLETKFITFVDSNFYHSDRLSRDSNISKDCEKKYFKKLKFFLKNIKQKYKKPLIICLHPGSDYQLYKSYLKGLNIKKQNSLYYISKSSLCIFHESSLILDAFNLNKKILILKSETLGDYYKLRINEYIKVFKLSYLNLDLKENNLTKKLNILKVKSSKKKKKAYKINKKIFFLINKLF